MKKIKVPRLDIKTPSYARVFFISLITAAVVIIPFMVMDKGYFFLYGDFNVQQVPFYQLAHESIRSGNIFWNHNTDLGVNFIGSYTFYLLGSPFFWLTLPFPNWFVPYLIGPLMILKLACAATTGYAYIKRFVKTPELAVIGGILYAFSGFSLFNTFFFHFHEPIIFFPLLLVALEEAVVNDRKWCFAFAVFINITVNYFFFVGEVVFCIIYFFVRLISKDWELTPKRFLRLAGEAILGAGMSAVLVLPAVLATIENPRTDNPIGGWNALIYWDKYRPLQILCAFFFPPDLPARPNFTPDSSAKWASLGAWLPMFGMTGVIAYFQHTKHRDWLRRLLIIFVIMAFVPFLNQAFYMFNESYYARWYYMLTLLMALATMKAIDGRHVDWNRAIGWSAGITLFIAATIGFFKYENEKDKPETGLMKYPERFWIYVAIAMLAILLTAAMVSLMKKDRRRAISGMLAGTLCFSVITFAYFIAVGKSMSYDPRTFIIPYAIESDDIDLTDMDSDRYRIDVYKSMDNMAIYWGLPSINAFHSMVPASVMEFYPEVGVDRGVGTRPEVEEFGLRSLLSVRWLFDEVGDGTEFSDKSTGETLMPGYKYYATQNGFDIWENECYLPMGYTFDKYISYEDFENTGKSIRHQLLLKGIVLDEEQEKKYSSILPKLNMDEVQYSFASNSDYDVYFEDCRALQDEVCDTFEYTRTGFNASINLEKSNLVFFSVPYDSGWTAYVNGEPAEIEKVDVGFMAVLCGAGENTIEFKYMTPGLKEGAIVSGASFAIAGVLILCDKLPAVLKKRKKKAGLDYGDE